MNSAVSHSFSHSGKIRQRSGEWIRSSWGLSSPALWTRLSVSFVQSQAKLFFPLSFQNLSCCLAQGLQLLLSCSFHPRTLCCSTTFPCSGTCPANLTPCVLRAGSLKRLCSHHPVYLKHTGGFSLLPTQFKQQDLAGRERET